MFEVIEKIGNTTAVNKLIDKISQGQVGILLGKLQIKLQPMHI